MLLVAAVLGTSASAAGFVRSVALRIVLPWTGLPLLIGVEASTELAFGLGTASFFLTTDGRALITLGGNVALTESEERGMTYLRLTTGLAYFDTQAYGPDVVFGLGLAYEFRVLDAVAIGFASEFLYPIAFPVPMFSASAGWILP